MLFRELLLSAALIAGGLLVPAAGCGPTASTLAHEDDEEPAALILATDEYELHYRDGHVLLVEPGEEGAPARVRVVESAKEFRGLYDVREAEDSPPATTPDASAPIEVTGWRNYDCVREGHACGRMPEPHSRGDAIRLKLVFPRR